MYVIMYREDLGEFVVVKGEVHEGNVSGLHAYIDKDNAEELAITLNNFIAKGKCDVKKCKACGLHFLLGPEEKDWFLSKHFHLPKRCKLCRDNKIQSKPVPIHDGSNCYVRDENNQWVRASLEVFREKAMKYQPRGCSCAIYDEVDGCY